MTAEPLREVRALVDNPPSTQPGLWERAAILLARQALEGALDDFWRARAPDLLHASMRAQPPARLDARPTPLPGPADEQ